MHSLVRPWGAWVWVGVTASLESSWPVFTATSLCRGFVKLVDWLEGDRSWLKQISLLGV